VEPYVHDAALDMHHAREQLNLVLDKLSPADYERFVPFGDITVKDVLAHLAAADQTWAVAAQDLLKAEGGARRPPLTIDEARALRARGIDRGRTQSVDDLREEMVRRRKLLLSLYDLLERPHLALTLPSFGSTHNSVRERIWRGYHDRLHLADVERALRSSWRPQDLTFLPETRAAVAALSPDETLYVVWSVDAVQWERRTLSSEWTYRQLLAHIASGDWVLQTHLRSLVEDGDVAPWPDVEAGNAARIEERRFSTDTALTEEYLSMRHETLRLISQLKRENLARPIEFWWEPRPNTHTVLEYIDRFEAHDRTHRDQLRPAMKYLHAHGVA
jgi:hypothetical protein